MSSNTQSPAPVKMLQYRDISGWMVHDGSMQHSAEAEAEAVRQRTPLELSEEELADKLARARVEGAKEAEQRIRTEYEQKLIAARAPIATAIAGFEQQRDQYYSKVEAEIVQLALAIAAKILHRESQVDPMLVAALVRLAMEHMREESSVTIRVRPEKAAAWRHYFAGITPPSRVEIAEDPQLAEDDCMMETELGSANFGIEKQLKEVEQGFFDLLALRPGK